MRFFRLKTLVVLLALLFCTTASVALAQDYEPIVKLPAINVTETGLSGIIQALFQIIIGIAGFAAVIMIAYSGFQYMTTEAVSGKSDARERLTAAILGLIIVLSAVFVLTLINPNITDVKLFQNQVTSPQNTNSGDTSNPPQTPNNGTPKPFISSLTLDAENFDVPINPIREDELTQLQEDLSSQLESTDAFNQFTQQCSAQGGVVETVGIGGCSASEQVRVLSGGTTSRLESFCLEKKYTCSTHHTFKPNESSNKDIFIDECSALGGKITTSCAFLENGGIQRDCNIAGTIVTCKPK